MTAKTPISEAILSEAKKLYMEYMPIKTIASQLNVNRTSIQYHANSHWEVEREMQKAEMFKAFSSQKKLTMTKLSEYTLKILTRALEEASKSDEPPTLREAQQTALILESIDKIMRLDDGTPTEITEGKPITTIELKKRLQNDPFAGEIKEVEFKEVED